ncbi:MAG TPA: hypothetical protein VGP92_03145, partial [Acidimicrobiia bacterium]|nr:hypothetical protein [Acidimicrobiia bacterium]
DDVELAWSRIPGGRADGRIRWLAPLTTGLVGTLVVAPWVGVLTAAVTSVVGVILCLAIIGYTWTRRRAVITTAATPLAGDDDVDLAWSRIPGARADGRIRWLAPLTTGLVGALVVAPWVGVLTAAVTLVVVLRPKLRAIVMTAPAALLALCGLYVVVQQYRYRYPSVLEWPTLFPHARTLAWIAVVLLMADAVVEILLAHKRGPGPAPDTS